MKLHITLMKTGQLKKEPMNPPPTSQVPLQGFFKLKKIKVMQLM